MLYYLGIKHIKNLLQLVNGANQYYHSLSQI